MDMKQSFLSIDEVQPTLSCIDEIFNVCFVIDDVATYFLPFADCLCGQLIPSRTWIMQSVVGTIRNIKGCVNNICFGDAYTLLRKYEEDLFLLLYHECVIGTILPKDEQSIEQLLDIYQRKRNGSIDDLTANEKKVRAWACNRQKNLRFDDMYKYILKDSRIKAMDIRFGISEKLAKIRSRLNNHVHTNGVSFLNMPPMFGTDMMKKQKDIADQFNYDIRLITLVYVSFLSLIAPIYIMASDYFDNLDCGQTPPEGSMYWVAPSIAQFVDSYQSLIGADLLDYLEENTPMCFRESLQPSAK